MVQDDHRTETPTVGVPAERRPVLLATLSVRVAPEAERVAVESALDAQVPLIVVNVISPPPCATTMIRLQGDLEMVRQTVARAAARGVPTEHLTRVPAWGPIRALVALARERNVGLVVFGPDRRHASRRRYRRAAQAVCDRLDCLVWIPAD